MSGFAPPSCRVIALFFPLSLLFWILYFYLFPIIDKVISLLTVVCEERKGQ